MCMTFKQTEIGKVPEAWNVVPLDELATPLMGQSPSSQYVSSEKSVNSLPFYQGNSEFDGKYLGAPKAYCSEPTRIAESNSVLISVRAPVGAVSITKERISIGRGLAALSCTSCNPDFLFYYLLANESRWDRIKQGSTFESVNKKEIHDFLIAAPKPKEQIRIASILSCTDSAISETNEIIEKSRALKKGLMQELLTRGIGHTEFKQTEIGEVPEEWAIVKLSEIVDDFITGGTPSTSNPEYWNGVIPWTRSAALTKKILAQGEKLISQKGLENSASKIVPKNNILMASRVSIGNVAINTIDVAISQDLTGLLMNKQKASEEFIYWMLLLSNKRIQTLVQGSTIQGLSQKDIKQFKIALPNVAEQIHIASILSSADSKIESELEKRIQLELLKKGLMQNLLTGRVRVKLEVDT